MRLFLVIAILLFSMYGCVEVMPWEKDILAKKSMALEGYDAQITKIQEHIYTSKEGTKGGGAAGGGCGCN